MRQEYISSLGILDKINELVPYENFKLKEKIDVIIHDHNFLCHCGKLSKFGSEYCSLSCRNKDKKIRKKIGEKNRENKVSRAAKMKETLLEKYGVTAVQSIPTAKEKTKQKKEIYYKNVIEQTFSKYGVNLEIMSDTKFLEPICKEVSLNTISNKFFNNMPNMTIKRHFDRIGFDYNPLSNSSLGERNLGNWIKSLGFVIETTNRSIIKPKELDIYIPMKKLAIEFNGVYYHSTVKVNKEYHKNKLDMCEKEGVKLIQIFEDEWYFKEPIVKSLLKSKLGLIENKIYARNCTFKKVSKKEADGFLNDNHMQGKAIGTTYGLYYKEKLVCVMTVGKSRYYKEKHEIIRFCSILETIIVGGFTKLLSNVKRELNVQEFYTYADLRYSDGSTYEKNGKYIKTTEPGYFWCKGNSVKRISRYQTQKSKLKDFLKEKFDPSLTEKENMENAGYEKVYDCGHKLYVV